MRRGFWAGLALAGVMVLAGCSGSEKGAEGGESKGAPAAEKKIKVGIVFDTGGRNDKSFNASAWRGAEKCQTELGAEVLPVESNKESDYTGNLSALADKGCDIVIGVGITMRTAVEQAAPNYPDTKFVSIDGEPLPMDNVRTIQFAEHEGSFLVGYIAGLVSKTGKVGFVGGMKLPLIEKFRIGYTAGVKTARKDAEVLPAKFIGDWVNTDQAKVAAELLYGSGADIVYHAAGKGGLGVIAAAKEKNLFAIGVDSDQDDVAEGRVLTSMIKNVDEGVFQTVKDLKEGKWTAGAVTYDLKSGGVGTSAFRFTKNVVGEDNLKKLDQVKQQIVSGEIKVPYDEASFAEFLTTLKG